MVVGIGDKLIGYEDQLKEIATEGLVYMIHDFDDLPNVLGNLTEQICSKFFNNIIETLSCRNNRISLSLIISLLYRLRPRRLRIKRYHARFRAIMVKYTT